MHRCPLKSRSYALHAVTGGEDNSCGRWGSRDGPNDTARKIGPYGPGRAVGYPTPSMVSDPPRTDLAVETTTSSSCTLAERGKRVQRDDDALMRSMTGGQTQLAAAGECRRSACSALRAGGWRHFALPRGLSAWPQLCRDPRHCSCNFLFDLPSDFYLYQLPPAHLPPLQTAQYHHVYFS
jgi:hypothetical protein